LAGRVYNVADPDSVTESDWTAKIGVITGWGGQVIAVPRERAPRHLIQPYRWEQHLFMDSKRIRSELGYAELFSVDEALRRTIEWEKANPPAQQDHAQYDYKAEDAALADLGWE
jgi:nucleoside-diphosphate-sugar epimerase